jgi:uncharacterized RDD family membrane protein YckC
MEDFESRPQYTYELATVGMRFVAFIIDNILLFIIGFIVGLFLAIFNLDSIVVGILINLVYHWYFLTRREGQTPGKSAVNIRVIKTDGTPISDSDAIIRVFGYYVSSIALGIGFLWAIFDANNQGWHDKMANTYVVTAEKVKKQVTI